jgi:hypothetical protein
MRAESAAAVALVSSAAAPATFCAACFARFRKDSASRLTEGVAQRWEACN